jgi:hypothetical protein
MEGEEVIAHSESKHGNLFDVICLEGEPKP